MKLFAEGIVTNHFNEALFILRDENRTWALPGGAVGPGEEPPQTVARRVEDETGIKIRPVRLVGLYYWPDQADGRLLFSFRCLQEGGELQAADETPNVGFMPVTPPPRPMLARDQERLNRALAHDGGPPYWDTCSFAEPVSWVGRLRHRYRALRRRLAEEAPDQASAAWRIGASTVLQNEAGEILWVKRTDHDLWNLPGGGHEGSEAPWETAIRETQEETGLDVRLSDLAGVYTKPERQEMVLTFTAVAVGGRLSENEEAAAFAYFAPGAEPENAIPKHVERAGDAVSPVEETVFHIQDGPSVLGRSGAA